MIFYAVFDANNFYVSCERVVQPRLQKLPTVVISSSGGIVLARSNEAKALGIPMAAPMFQFKEVFERNNIQVIPANFGFYGEISGRIASILHEQFPHVEEYSIDESFILLPNVTDVQYILKKCREVRELILKWTGVPVSVGIAYTKTLAKVAVKYAKTDSTGVVVIASDAERQEKLKGFDVQDVWGIGRALGPKMIGYGIQDALSLANQEPMWGKKHFSVVLAHTINELKGIPCIRVEEQPAPQKTTMATGTFEKEITDKEELREALKNFARRAGRHLRRNKEVAGGMTVFVRGNRFKTEGRQLRSQVTEVYSPPTAYTPTFLHTIDRIIDSLYTEGTRVKRAGVYCFDLMPEDSVQLGLFGGGVSTIEKENKVMQVIDKIARKSQKKVLQIRI